MTSRTEPPEPSSGDIAAHLGAQHAMDACAGLVAVFRELGDGSDRHNAKAAFLSALAIAAAAGYLARSLELLRENNPEAASLLQGLATAHEAGRAYSNLQARELRASLDIQRN